MHKIFAIAETTFLELVHERLFYLLALLGVMGLGVSLLLGNLTYVEQEKLTVDFLLGGTHLFMIFFSICMGISLLQREQAQGTLALVLAKPVGRHEYLLGKFMGQMFAQTVCIFSFGILIAGLCMKASGMAYVAPVLQALGMIFLEVWIVTAATHLFAVVAGPLIAGVATGVVFILGHSIETLESLLNHSEGGWLWKGLLKIIPNLEVFNIKTSASYALTIPMSAFAWPLLYAAICCTFFLLAAVVCFQNRDILT